mgnify:CR=1 FL=1
MTYTLQENRLQIRYQGRFDRDTVFNMTHHAYFNLAGQDRPEAAMSQTLQLRARQFTEVDHASIPTGRLLPVAGTPLDFRTPKALGLDSHHPLLAPQGGLDHNFVLDPGAGPAARLVCNETGGCSRCIPTGPAYRSIPQIPSAFAAKAALLTANAAASAWRRNSFPTPQLTRLAQLLGPAGETAESTTEFVWETCRP